QLPSQTMECLMLQSIDDLSRSLVALDQNTTVIAVVELSSSAWLIGGMVPGIARDPLKKRQRPTQRLCFGCCIAGATKPSRPVRPSHALSLRSKPAETASGWHGG